jgi:hypothetical protein
MHWFEPRAVGAERSVQLRATTSGKHEVAWAARDDRCVNTLAAEV